MPIVVVTQPSDGTTADAADLNSQINAILAVVNGHIDQDNLADGGVTNAKLAGGITIDKMASSALAGWAALSAAPNSATNNGMRSYNLVFNALDLSGILSPGMRLKLTRSVTAPTQCTNLNGTTQYYSKTSPNKMTFTDDFVVSVWVKLASYQSSGQMVVSRNNNTSGWFLRILPGGSVHLEGNNAASANYSSVESYAALPLNRWVHVAAQLDMSAFTATPTTSYVMFDGVDVPAVVARGGTNPTALIQAGNLEIGSFNGGAQPFAGKIAQVAIYSAKVTQAIIASSMNQTLSGSETSLASAYSFNNSVADLNTTTPNDLTPNGSAVATTVDSPFAGGTAAPYAAGTTEFAEVFNVSFSTNTTVVVQVPDGYAIPTSGGISAISYSANGRPLGWPGRTSVLAHLISAAGFASTTVGATGAAIPEFNTTVYVPNGRNVKITVYCYAFTLSTNNSASIKVWNGAPGSTEVFEVQSGAQGAGGNQALMGFFSGALGAYGSNNFTASIAVNAGQGTMNSFPGSKAYATMTIELVD